ncbi:MAG TPA: Hsp70 family protein [Myxococcaceae bacterium]|nr:Hsp70 family protein [Myxococcaceae bacterium]
MSACGLDFGTSNSALALPNGTVLPIDPSADEPRLLRSVLFFPDSERGTYAGAEAIRLYLEEGSGRFIQSAKSWLPSRSFHATQVRGGAVRLEELVAVLLRTIRGRAEKAVGHSLDRVVMGRPAVFSPQPDADALAEARLRRAAELAGFIDVRFLIEPIAAALTYEASLTREERVLVGDFGAGTSDFTLMRLGPSRRGAGERRGDILGSTGVRIGGDNFDGAIMQHTLLPHFGAGSHYRLGSKRLAVPQHIFGKLLSWHEMSFIRERSTQELLHTLLTTSERPEAAAALYDLVVENLGYGLFRAIERVKVQLSSYAEATLEFDEARVHLSERITRDAFERFCAPLLQGLSDCVDRLMSSHEVDALDAVFLTGGTSHIPAVRRIFETRFGPERIRTGDAFTSVAEGLGRAAGVGT